MTDQLNLLGVAPPLPGEAATTPGRQSAPHAAHPAGRPPKPSPDHVLRARCEYCGQYPTVGETTGKFVGHNYHRSDFKARQGRCAGAGKRPDVEPTWVKRFR